YDWAMYRYPSIDLKVNNLFEANPPNQAVTVLPSNTDLSDRMPKPTPDDAIFDITNLKDWNMNGLEVLREESDGIEARVAGNDPFLEYNRALDLCVGDFTHFYFRMAISREVYPRASQIFFQTDGQPSYQRSPNLSLLADGEVHEYTYDLKLLELNPRQHITGIRLDPLLRDPSGGKAEVKIFSMRFIRGEKSSACQ